MEATECVLETTLGRVELGLPGQLREDREGILRPVKQSPM